MHKYAQLKFRVIFQKYLSVTAKSYTYPHVIFMVSCERQDFL